MSSTYVLTSIPYNLEDIRLGSLIPDVRQPHSDALPLDATSVSDGPVDVSVRTDQNLQVGLKTSERSWFDAHLSRLINASYDRSQKHEVQISAFAGHIYELRSPKAVFKALIKRTEVREWLQEGILAGDKTYMVVGYRTFSDASATRNAQASRKAAGDVKIPAADAALGVPGAGQVLGLDGAAGAGQAASSKGNQQATFPGERIYAVCYRRVKFGFTRKVEKAQLETSNQWIMYPETKGATADEDAEIVDADLDDEEGALGEDFAQASTTADDEVVFATLV